MIPTREPLPTSVSSSVLPPTDGQTLALTDGHLTPVYNWQVHPLRDEPERIPLIAASVAVAMAFWWFVLPQPLLLSLPALFLLFALNDFLFPATYRITTEGVHADCGLSRLFLAWSDVGRVTHGSDGIYLSPFSRPSRLEAFRGVRLRYDGNADIVKATVRFHWHKSRARAHDEKVGFL